MRSKWLESVGVACLVLLIVLSAALLSTAITAPGIAATGENNRPTGATLSDDREAGPKEIMISKTCNDNLIRFHVIANSDSERDQALKRKVRDLIVTRMTPEFKAARNLAEARGIAKAHLAEIKNIAVGETWAWGENYSISVQLGKYDFPIKTYGKVTLPAGRYEAVRVVIGKGQGANWWCVLFPPLCFVDVSRAMAPQESQFTAANVYARNSLAGLLSPESNTTRMPLPDGLRNISIAPPASSSVTADYGEWMKSDQQETYQIRFKLLEVLGLSSK